MPRFEPRFNLPFCRTSIARDRSFVPCYFPISRDISLPTHSGTDFPLCPSVHPSPSFLLKQVVFSFVNGVKPGLPKRAMAMSFPLL